MSYGWVEVAEADSYFATRLGASTYWTSGVEKEAALQTAYEQLISSPRLSLPSSTTDAMKKAQYEQALFLLQQGASVDLRKGLQVQGTTAVSTIGESFAQGASLEQMPICTRALAYLAAYDVEKLGTFHMVDIERDDAEEN